MGSKYWLWPDGIYQEIEPGIEPHSNKSDDYEIVTQDELVQRNIWEE